ncbi:hypothetical protein [Vibrio coralliilyticus]|uniref:hypothetical protein n=1 Tax=Vibrio coralliilyticus TaxID=190893 RepID=UPI001799C3FD|nr:hypothetical protein [Vibrio coralliilyticus]NUW69566.1 hypothetical protein [Vibrio coralliilyticus]
MALVQIFSNKKCLPLEIIPTSEHSSNFYCAVAQMERRAGHPVSFIAEGIAIIPLKGDKRLVVMRT